jgi:hypothetical protein
MLMPPTDPEELRRAVMFLYHGTKDGVLEIDRSKNPGVEEALQAVQFDEDNNLIIDSVREPLLQFAHRVAEIRQRKLEREREEASPVNDVLLPPVAVNTEVLDKARKAGDFGETAFELYKETASVAVLASGSFIGMGPEECALPRNQAISAGLLVRIGKFMLAVVQLTAETDRGEVVMVLNRCIAESSINLRFLICKNEERFYDQFVSHSLAPERELYELVNKNIRESGRELPIETRILAAITRTCDKSGVSINDIDPNMGDWGGGLRNRLKALKMEEAYASVQRIPSHAVHGTWVDLVTNHLECKPTGFSPDPTWQRVDPRSYLPTCILVLDAAEAYFSFYFKDIPELRPLYRRISDLRERIGCLDSAHEEWYHECWLTKQKAKAEVKTRAEGAPEK